MNPILARRAYCIILLCVFFSFFWFFGNYSYEGGKVYEYEGHFTLVKQHIYNVASLILSALALFPALLYVVRRKKDPNEQNKYLLFPFVGVTGSMGRFVARIVCTFCHIILMIALISVLLKLTAECYNAKMFMMENHTHGETFQNSIDLELLLAIVIPFVPAIHSIIFIARNWNYVKDQLTL